MTGMQKIRYCALGAVLLLSVSSVSVLAACGRRSFAAVTSETATHPFAETERETVQTEAAREKKNDERMEEGNEGYRGFTLDDVLHSEEGDIHFNLYIPESYDGNTPYALYLTLPGYEGLYFQGVGINIQSEDFAFEAQKYNEKMIIVAPQLEDWGEISARKTVSLTEYLLDHYSIDRTKVYINGYSGGGETLSMVLDMHSELYTAALMCSSRWDGGYDTVTAAKIPVYFVIGDSDEYYSADPFRKAYQEIRKRYEAEGLTEDEISKLVQLDVKPESYFRAGGVNNQHGGGGMLFPRDESVMGWLFGEH